MNYNSLNTIYVKSQATRGIKRVKETTSKSGFVCFMQKLFGALSVAEYIWYAAFFVAGIVCLCVFKFSPMLLVTVLSLYIYMISCNLQARGLVAGLVAALVSSSVYVGVCVVNHVWGEVIANVLIYMPLNIIALFKWKRLPSQNDNPKGELSVTKMDALEWLFYLSFLAFGTIGLGLFLQEVVHQQTAFVNAAGILVCLCGMFARNNGKREMWLFYFASDTMAITLWLMVVLRSGDFSSFPMCISSFASFFNSMIGVAIWSKLYKKNHVTTGTYLAKSRKKINKIIKLRRNLQNLSWSLATDENWVERSKQKKSRYKGEELGVRKDNTGKE